jgi:hypothetical protein
MAEILILYTDQPHLDYITDILSEYGLNIRSEKWSESSEQEYGLTGPGLAFILNGETVDTYTEKRLKPKVIQKKIERLLHSKL